MLRNKDAYPFNTNKSVFEQVRRESTISYRSGGTGGTDGDATIPDAVSPQEPVESVKQEKSVEQITDEFRNTLLYGLVQEALGKFHQMCFFFVILHYDTKFSRRLRNERGSLGSCPLSREQIGQTYSRIGDDALRQQSSSSGSAADTLSTAFGARTS